ncbi:hypothetical protein CRX72_02595 [Pantoea sp. BRM17]|nr:hypothetical protein CRX72_02595 [Pantoea sp. BRM17]
MNLLTRHFRCRSGVRKPRSSLPGGVIGFFAYWCALAIPFLLYGSNTLFFFLYTWPFFLALLPVSVLAGIVLSLMMRGHLFWLSRWMANNWLQNSRPNC